MTRPKEKTRDRRPGERPNTSVASRRVVLGVIGDDIHIVANRLLEIALSEAGFTPYNLYTSNKPEAFVAACLETEAHAVLVSSINGEAEYWCADFRRRFEAAGIGDVVLYIGGNLTVGYRDEAEVVSFFKSCGFNRVFCSKTNLAEAVKLLAEDLGLGIS